MRFAATAPAHSAGPVLGLFMSSALGREAVTGSGLHAPAIALTRPTPMTPAPRRRATKEEEGAAAYLRKADYGKVPEYLQHVKREVEEEKEMISAMMGESSASERGREADIMPEEERAALLDALKRKWGDVSFRYQKITHANNEDTIGKKRRCVLRESLPPRGQGPGVRPEQHWGMIDPHPAACLMASLQKGKARTRTGAAGEGHQAAVEQASDRGGVVVVDPALGSIDPSWLRHSLAS